MQNYRYEDGRIFWRDQKDIPPATTFINSPYDPEARFGKKRSTMWTGYKVHLTETCEEHLPHLITHVATIPAPKSDEAMTESIHTDLQQADLLPAEHLLDTGYVTARTLVTSQERFGVKMIGLVLTNLQWQACVNQGIDASQFAIDWEHQLATCPQGRTSRSWTSVADPRGHPLIRVHFSSTDCGHCPVQSRCIHSTEKYKQRVLTLHPRAQHEALQAARKLQQTPAFTQQYHLREGIEATISQGVRAFGMRRSRSIGEAKTHLQHVGIAAAINVCRLMDWLDGIGPAPTRISAFQRLFLAA